MKRLFSDWKLYAGILISILFMFLAFRKVEPVKMFAAFSAMRIVYLVPMILVMFLSHWLRAVRWRYLLSPVRRVGTAPLFTSLIIGYMFNIFLPAHLGEFVRAFVLSAKKSLSASSIFATIVVERVIDVLTLLLLLALTMVFFPFPGWVRRSGLLTFAGLMLLFVMLLLMKRHRTRASRLLERVPRIGSRLSEWQLAFTQGLAPLSGRWDYAVVFVLSVAIWACYGIIFQLLFFSFEFHLPWIASLVTLVITTISVVVPSSPGYVGTYHYLCQISLGLFGIGESAALSYAFVAHGINFLPVLVLGLIFVSREGRSFRALRAGATEIKSHHSAEAGE